MKNRRAILQIDNVTRADSGTYAIKVHNAGGACESSARVLVTSRPDALNSLNPDIVCANEITLSWDKPANDGGKPVTGYEITAKKVK